MTDSDRESLDALLSSDGWRLFTAFVDAEWGAGGRAFIAAVTGAANGTDNATAMAHLQQILVAQREIQKILQWPEEQLRAMRQPELVAATHDYSRRGNL